MTTTVSTTTSERTVTALRRRIGAVDAWTWAWIGLAAVTLLVVVGNDFGVFAPDTKPELYLNPDRLLRRSLSAWQPDPQLGQSNYNTGILPVAALMTGVQVLGLPPWLVQRLFMTALLLVGAVGMGTLVTQLTRQRGAGPWLAGVIYAWHPWVVVGAATLPVRLPHALVPWVLVFLHRAATGRDWRNAAWAALAYSAMAGINGGVVNLMMVVPVVVMVGWLVATRQVGVRPALASLVRVATLAIGMSLYWLLPSLVSIGGGAGSVLAATEAPAAIGRLSPASEVIRGMGMWTSYIVIDGQVENPEQLALLTSGAVVTAGFLLLATSMVALAAASRQIQSLCLAMGGIGIGLMLGLTTSGGPTPLGRALAWSFETFPTLAAFRTTNKWGSMLVLAVALAVGAGVGTARWRQLMALPAFAATPTFTVVGIAILVGVAAGPLLPGQLHPLQVPVPDYWFDAAASTDEIPGGDTTAGNGDAASVGDDVDRSNHRLLLLPGNAQTRYLWGHRGVDDLDTALFDHRSVVWRSTIPQGSAAATNMLTAFDVGLQQATLSPDGFVAHTRLLGADAALVRTDTDWLRNFGRPTSEVLADVTANPGIDVTTTFGPTASTRGIDAEVVDPDDPALTLVALPQPVPSARPLVAPLLVVGDATAIDPMVRAGLAVTDRPLLWVDDLSADALAAALDAGGHVVLTDTNRRRAWSISSVTDSHTPVLTATTPVAPSDQRSRTFDQATQTVAEPSAVTVTASPEPYAVIRRRAAGHPGLAYDANPLTGWQYGTQTDGIGGWIELASATPALVDDVQVVVGTSGKAITEVLVETEDRSVVVPVVDGSARAQIGEATDRIRVTIADTFGFSTAPATIQEVIVSGDPDVWRPLAPTLRLPMTLPFFATAAPDLVPALAAAPTTIVLSRLAGNPTDPFDDEEARLRRTWTMAWDMELDPAATVGSVVFPDDVPADVCREVALVGDGAVLHAVRAAPLTAAVAGEAVDVRGCGAAVELPAGTWTLAATDLVSIEHLGVGTAPPAATSRVPSAGPDDAAAVRTTTSPTSVRLRLPASATPTVVSSGQAWDPGWRAQANGIDLGAPITVDGWAAGWIVPPDVTDVVINFGPQRVTRLGQALALLTLGASLALALRRRRP